MNATWISIGFFLCTFGGALLGLLLQSVVPAHHLSIESKKVVQVASGLIATLSALVLGLLVGSVHSSFDAKGDAVKRMASQLIMLDRLMAEYGPEAKEARSVLRETAAGRFSKVFTDANLQTKLSHADQVTTGLERVQRLLLDFV